MASGAVRCVCSVESHHAEAVEPLDERDLAALFPTQLLKPVGEHLARSLPAADLRQIVEQSRRRVVVGRCASLDELDDLAPRLVLPPRELVQVGLASAFGGATAFRGPPVSFFPSRTLPILAAPPGLREQILRCPAVDVAGPS